jgi:NAD(P)-dependent dehydrogenase (short-subunit alcohol dehydrogenase family)
MSRSTAPVPLADRIAVVTGGGRDLGRDLALALAEAGADVVVLGRTRVTVEATAAEIVDAGRRAWAAVCDVTDEQQVDATFDEIAHRFGAPHVLVNNAAAPRHQHAVADMPLDAWNETLSVKLTGAMLCTRAALRSMIPAGRGSIVNVSGTTGKVGLAYVSAHSVAQAGLIAFTQSLAREVGRHGIRANAIVPSAIEGEHLRRITSTNDAITGAGTSLLDQLSASSPLGRLVQPQEVAAGVVFLASDASSGMTGQTLDLLL